MCMSSPKVPPAPPPPAPPAPPPPAKPLEPAVDISRNSTVRASRGRASLRIDRTTTMDGSGGSGLNIPN